MNDKIPILLVTGFLGAGKTTLLNAVLSQDHGERVAVLVNEFGAVGVDGTLLDHNASGLIEMKNGCVCCTIRTDLVEALERLSQSGKIFDRVVVETTGLADPVPLIQTFLGHETMFKRFSLRAVLTVVDAKHFEQQKRYLPLAEEQVACADIILLNKIDLVTPTEKEATRSTLARINPSALLLESEQGRVPFQQLWTYSPFDVSAWAKQRPAEEHHDHLRGIVSLVLETSVPLSRERFVSWLGERIEEATPDLYRYKGFLRFVGDDGRTTLLQGVHREYALTPFEGETSSPQTTSQLVFIGRNLDETSFRETFSTLSRESA